MKIKYIVYILIIGCGLWGCSGNKKATKEDHRIVREPIKEVTQAQLDADSRLIEALSLQTSGHTNEAIAAYAKLTSEDAGCAAAWYEMGALLLQRGWTDSALACADRAVAINNKNIWYLREKAAIHEKRGEGKEMAQVYEQMVRLQPEVLEHYYDLSNAYLLAGDLPSAIEVLNRVEKKIGVTEPISLQKQRLWAAAGKPEKATKEIEALAAAMPKDKRYNAIMAEQYMQQKKYGKAKECYDRILAADPDDQYIHLQLAEYYKQTGNLGEADNEMMKAFANKGLDCTTKINMLRSFYTAEEFYGKRSKTTYKLLDLAMEGCADSAMIGPFYGDVLMRQQKYVEAAHWFELGLTRDSSNFGVWEALLICLTEDTTRTDAMADYAARASKLFPMHTLPHFIQGMVALQGDEYDKAIAHLRDAERWGFNHHYLEAETYRMMAEALYRKGQYAECWKAFDKSLAVDPNSVMTLNNYAYYLSEQNEQLEKAEQMSRRTIESEPNNANNLDTYAWILHLMGRNSEARQYIERAVKLNPNSETLRKHYEAIVK